MTRPVYLQSLENQWQHQSMITSMDKGAIKRGMSSFGDSLWQ